MRKKRGSSPTNSSIRAEYEKLCADFGIRLCSDIEDFNGLLKELGPDAVENATLYEDEDFDLS